jgi:hypothetical protein
VLFDDHVDVVGHEAIGQKARTGDLSHGPHQFEETCIVGVLFKQTPMVDPTGHDVVDAGGSCADVAVVPSLPP